MHTSLPHFMNLLNYHSESLLQLHKIYNEKKSIPFIADVMIYEIIDFVVFSLYLFSTK